MDSLYMKSALLQAKKAYLQGDVPIGAVIVKDNQVIAQGYNCKQKKQIATHHAEIIAIEKACKKLNNWHLDNCTLYVTLEPCLMCAGAIIQSRLSRVVYGSKSPKFGYVDSIDQILSNDQNNHHVDLTSGVCENESQELLKKVFSERRGEK